MPFSAWEPLCGEPTPPPLDPPNGRKVETARRTYGKIRQNLFWAFAYNVVGIPLAAADVLSPVITGAAMALSSVSVVANTLLLKRWKPAD